MAMGLAGGEAGRGRRGRRGRSARAPMAEINVTPFVDVMLVLLIIFMVTAPLLSAGVPLDLPDSRAKALSEEQFQVTLSLGADRTVYIEDDPVPLAQVPDALAALPRQKDGKPPLVTLRADKALDYGAVMQVMGELNRAGFNAITLVTNAAGALPAPGPITERQARTVSDGSGAAQ
jgi:biopolymer transport protein TolR